MVHSRKRFVKKKRSNKNDGKAATEVAPTGHAQFKNHIDSLVEAYYHIVSEVEDYAIILLDTKGKILTWNKGAEKVKGYSASEIIGKSYKTFYTKEDKIDSVPDKILHEAEEKGRASYEGWRVKKDGTRFWGSITITALHNEHGMVAGFLKVTRDLTERKIAEDQLGNYLEELRQKNEALKKSEERYHKMVSEVKDYAIILLDKEGRVLDWNKGAEKLKGYTSKEIIGKSFRMFYPKEDKEAKLPERLLGEAVRKGSVLHEGWRVRKDGIRFWGSVAITALRGDDDEIIGFSKVTRDLTKKKAAEDQLNILMEELQQKNEELRQSETRYHKMIAEVQDYAIILLDENGNIQNWNVGAERIKGYSSSEIIGKSFRIFYTKEDADNKMPEKLISEARRNGKVSHEGWRVRKDGSRFWGNITITALHDEEGSVIGFSKVTRDLTERKKAEDALKANAAQLDIKNKTLERLNQELSSFSYVASHDLKEPLRKIQTFAQRITARGGLTDADRDDIEKIKSSAARMQRLIEDLMSYSLVSNDKTTFEKVNLNDILVTVKNDLEITIHEKNATIEADRLPVLQGVSFQLHQLFLNLVSNSIKFSKADESPFIKITYKIIKGPDIPGEKATGNNKYHQITFCDNGIGFAPEYSTKMFEAFQKLHPKNVFAGSGIGLAIVKKVMENHNGIIVAEGKPDVGATFYLYFPVS